MNRGHWARGFIRTCARYAAVVWLLIHAFTGQVTGQTLESTVFSPNVVLDDRYPSRENQFPNGVTGLADVVFATYVGYRPLRLDLYLPALAREDDVKYPLVVVIHGGGWQSGHTRHFGAFADWPAALAALAADGFVVASVEYRLSKEAPFPAALNDVRHAIRWLRANSEAYGIDETRVAAFGASAGGQLAALVGTACGDKTNPTPPVDTETALFSEPACLQGVVVWYGVFDFGLLTQSVESGGAIPEAVALYLDCPASECRSDNVRAASAIDWIDSADPPFLLIHGTDDPVVPVQQSRAMNAALNSAGIRSTLIEIPGVKHSFIGSTPEATIEASRQAWKASIDFIREVLRDKPRGAG